MRRNHLIIKEIEIVIAINQWDFKSPEGKFLRKIEKN